MYQLGRPKDHYQFVPLLIQLYIYPLIRRNGSIHALVGNTVPGALQFMSEPYQPLGN